MTSDDFGMTIGGLGMTSDDFGMTIGRLGMTNGGGVAE
jgi:hypothetical protein